MQVTFISCVRLFLNSVLREAPAGRVSLDHLALGGEAFTLEFAARDCACIARLAGSPISTARPKRPSMRLPCGDATMRQVRSIPDRPSDSELSGLCAGLRVLSLCLREWWASFTSPVLGLARGYLNRAGLTAERFVADPHGERRLADVPDRGPGAVAAGRGAGVPGASRRAGEAARVPDRAWRDRGGAAAAGGGVGGRGGGARRMARAASSGWWATWCRRRAPRWTWRSFARRLLRRLPDYMVPSAFVVLERLPLTPNGKLDRRALPAPEVGAERAHVRRARPRRRCCARCLPRCSVSSVWVSTTTSSSLGGHSLLATRLIGRVRASLGVELSIRSLFEAPSVAALAGRLSSERPAARVPLVAGPRPSVVPLSYAQRRLWFLERLEGGEEGRGSGSGGGTYAIPLAVRLAGLLDRAALEGALNDLILRHESLRTVFPESAGVPRQEVVAASAARIELEVASVTEDELAAALTCCGGPGLRACAGAAAAGASLCDRGLVHRCHPITCCCWCCITLPATAGRCVRCCGILGRCTGRGWKAHRPRCRRFRCSTPTTRCGSRRCWARRGSGQRDRAAACVLEGGAEGAAGAARSSGRPPAAGGVEPPRRACGASIDADLHRGLVALSRVDGVEPVHGAAGGACRTADPAGGGDRHCAGQPDRGADRCGAGRACRVLRQHAGASHRHVGTSAVRAS